MEKKELVAIGGSAGSLEVILEILPKLPENFPYAIIVIVHRKDSFDKVFESVLKSRCKMKVVDPEDKTPISKGNIYVAPAGFHLLIEADYTFSLDYSEKVNFSRPNINVTFFNIAEIYKNKVIGILLSGANEDGAKGLNIIHEKGGFTIVQSPESASMESMPKGALKLFEPNLITDTDGILNFLISISKDEAPFNE